MRIGRIGAALVSRVKSMFSKQTERYDASAARRERRRAKRQAKSLLQRKRHARKLSAPRRVRQSGKLPKRIFGAPFGHRERYVAWLSLESRIEKNIKRLKLKELAESMKADRKRVAS